MAAEGGERKGGMHRDRATAAAIGALAFAAADMAHEALGHGVAALFTPGITLVSISTVALSTEGASRLVPLAGPLLNAVLGIVCMAAFRRGRGFGPSAFFVWLFATVNLLNAFGYGVYSAVLDFGDLTAAVQGLEHHFAWRIVMLAVGGVGYYVSLRIAAGSLARRPADVGVGSSKLSSLTVPAYVAGSTLLLAGAALNPMANLGAPLRRQRRLRLHGRSARPARHVAEGRPAHAVRARLCQGMARRLCRRRRVFRPCPRSRHPTPRVTRDQPGWPSPDGPSQRRS